MFSPIAPFSYGKALPLAVLATIGHGDVHTLFLVLAVLFVLGGLYLLFALQNAIGAVAAVVIAILIVVFLV